MRKHCKIESAAQKLFHTTYLSSFGGLAPPGPAAGAHSAPQTS